MPIKVQNNLPAKEILEYENIFVMDETRALKQEIRPLEICILNLMPLKEETELQILRALSNTPLQINITFMKVSGHESKNTSANHLNTFYSEFSELKQHYYDGMIITGAPVEHLEFEEVDYWPELTEIFEWTKKHVTSTFHICWGAQAGLYYHFGMKKHLLDEKMFGVFEHRVMNRKIPLVRGFDDLFMAPHSRHTAMDDDEIKACKDLQVLAESDVAGIYLCMTEGGKQIFVMGHSEYDRVTLQKEYERDKNKGLKIEPPVNYFPNDDDTVKPNLSWRSHSNALYSNWLNYYVYQITPYELEA